MELLISKCVSLSPYLLDAIVISSIVHGRWLVHARNGANRGML
jgi:hypothetical protein